MHTNIMELVFVIISLFVLIVTINIFISADIEYDFKKNIGYVAIKIFNILVFKSEVSIIAGYFNFIRKNKKVIQIKLDLNDVNFQLLTSVGEYFLKKISISKISTNATFMSYNPDILSLTTSMYYIVYGLIVSKYSNKIPDCDFENFVKINFFDNKIIFNFKIIMLITLFDFIWVMIRAIMKRSVYGKKQIGRNC